jgi:hypothetical protein
VVTRSQAVPVRTWVLVAPVTHTVRGIPTEFHPAPIRVSLRRRVALAAMADC